MWHHPNKTEQNVLGPQTNTDFVCYCHWYIEVDVLFLSSSWSLGQRDRTTAIRWSTCGALRIYCSMVLSPCWLRKFKAWLLRRANVLIRWLHLASCGCLSSTITSSEVHTRDWCWLSLKRSEDVGFVNNLLSRELCFVVRKWMIMTEFESRRYGIVSFLRSMTRKATTANQQQRSFASTSNNKHATHNAEKVSAGGIGLMIFFARPCSRIGSSSSWSNFYTKTQVPDWFESQGGERRIPSSCYSTRTGRTQEFGPSRKAITVIRGTHRWFCQQHGCYCYEQPTAKNLAG